MCIRLKTTGYSTYTYEAIKALGKLEPEMLTKYAQDIIPRLDDDEQCVRIEAIKALGKLEPEYAQDIIPNDNLRTP